MSHTVRETFWLFQRAWNTQKSSHYALEHILSFPACKEQAFYQLAACLPVRRCHTHDRKCPQVMFSAVCDWAFELAGPGFESRQVTKYFIFRLMFSSIMDGTHIGHSSTLRAKYALYSTQGTRKIRPTLHWNTLAFPECKEHPEFVPPCL